MLNYMLHCATSTTSHQKPSFDVIWGNLLFLDATFSSNYPAQDGGGLSDRQPNTVHFGKTICGVPKY